MARDIANVSSSFKIYRYRVARGKSPGKSARGKRETRVETSDYNLVGVFVPKTMTREIYVIHETTARDIRGCPREAV